MRQDVCTFFFVINLSVCVSSLEGLFLFFCSNFLGFMVTL